MTTACPACSGTQPELPVHEGSRRPNVTLSVPSMHCAGCMQGVESALNGMEGVESARVNLCLRHVSAFSDLPVERLVQRLADAGYQAFVLDRASLNKERDTVGRNLLLRLGVAGFTMMNVMLFSVAIWSGAQDATRDLFHMISAVIAVPAVLYSAQPFFKNAWMALQGWRVNMDVPISLAILLATFMSLFEVLNGGEHAYFDAALSLTFFLLAGRYLEHRATASARSAAAELMAFESHDAQRVTDTGNETVPVDALGVGDILLVPTGTRVPADGLLLGRQAVTDRSLLTGESDPVTHSKGAQMRAGEINMSAPFRLSVTAVGEDTSLRQITRMVEGAEITRNRYTTLADKAARIYAPLVHFLAAAAFVFWFWVSGDVRHALNIAIAVLIITCPCALGLAVPAVATAAIGKLFRLGFLVKSGSALERLAEIDTLIFDKTGTLTMPSFDVSLNGLNETACSVALGLAQHSSHPVSNALRLRLAGEKAAPIDNVQEHPGLGVQGMYQDDLVFLGQSEWVGSSDGGLSLRVGDQIWPLTHSDKLRPGAESALADLRATGREIQIFSGDTVAKTQALARNLGVERIKAGLTPQEKSQEVERLSAQGKQVCMIGDGLNDTAALANAHASIAPASALDAARSASDVVLIKDELTPLPDLFTIARRAGMLSKQNFLIAAAYNSVAIPVALAGHATPLAAALAMSASSITVLLNSQRVRVLK